MTDVVPAVETYRMFIAVPVPAAVREELQRLVAELRQRLPGDDIRWTRPDQAHLTLLFLGNVATGSLDSLKQSLSGVCGRFAPMQLHAQRLGFFPHARSPRVLWIWVHDDLGELVRLQRAVASACASFGSAQEAGNFTGHLTLGRARSMTAARAKLLADIAREMEGRALGDWRADSVELMRSELLQGGSRHSRLDSIALAGTPAA